MRSLLFEVERQGCETGLAVIGRNERKLMATEGFVIFGPFGGCLGSGPIKRGKVGIV